MYYLFVYHPPVEDSNEKEEPVLGREDVQSIGAAIPEQVKSEELLLDGTASMPTYLIMQALTLKIYRMMINTTGVNAAKYVITVQNDISKSKPTIASRVTIYNPIITAVVNMACISKSRMACDLCFLFFVETVPSTLLLVVGYPAILINPPLVFLSLTPKSVECDRDGRVSFDRKPKEVICQAII